MRSAALTLMLLMASACELLNPVAPPPEGEVSEPAEPAAQELPQPVLIAVDPPAAPQPEPDTLALLDLAAQVISSSTAEARRRIQLNEQSRYDADPTTGNLLRLTIVRAFSAALPADLQRVRADLNVLAHADNDLSDDQRSMALVALTMVDERLRLGEQIVSLQQQIDRLTEIEASMNHLETIEPATEDAP